MYFIHHPDPFLFIIASRLVSEMEKYSHEKQNHDCFRCK